MAGIKVNRAIRNLASTQAEVDKLFAALPAKKIKDKIFLLVVNTDDANDHIGCVMANIQNDYSGYAGIQKVTTGGGLTYSTNHPGGLAGLRDMIQQHRLHIVGFTYDVKTIDNVSQFDAPFDKISAHSTTQDKESFDNAIGDGKSDNDQEQFIRTVEEQFQLNPSTDLVFTVLKGMQLKLTFSVRGQAVVTK
jgi:hypothetical protein